jgi:hypothetical protein
MQTYQLTSTTPKRIDPRVRQLLVAMGLKETLAQWLPFHRTKAFEAEPNECHINAWVQMKYHGGEICSGWTIWQDRLADFVEAQFHTVWRDKSGLLRDLTPRQDGEREVLFLPDSTREITLTNTVHGPAIVTYDNVRMQSGVLTCSFSQHVRALKTNLIFDHGLAVQDTDSQ